LSFSGTRPSNISSMLTRILLSKNGMLTSFKSKCLFYLCSLYLFSFWDTDFLWTILVLIISILKFLWRLAKYDEDILEKLLSWNLSQSKGMGILLRLNDY
jgi:hypothetical protein